VSERQAKGGQAEQGDKQKGDKYGRQTKKNKGDKRNWRDKTRMFRGERQGKPKGGRKGKLKRGR
jgi:hypothetical protein